MKTKIFTLLFAMVTSVGTISAVDNYVIIDGLYYNIRRGSLRAEVTHPKYSDEYRGNIVIPKTIEYGGNIYGVYGIANGAFRWCQKLTSITLSADIDTIGPSAFGHCTGLTSINVDAENCVYCDIDGVLFKKNRTTLLAYPGGKAATYIIPDGVTSIGDYAFEGAGLTSVTIPNSVTSIGAGAFARSGLTSVTIPNSVTSIESYAFKECSSLTSVTLGNGVTSIGESVFTGCWSLISPVYNAYVFACLPFSYSGHYSIPDGIESIAATAFEYCSGLTSVTIPNSVTSIGKFAFEECTALTSVMIGNSVTSIGQSAFHGCTGLTSVTIPNSVISIGEDAFYECSSLTSVTLGNGVTSIGKYAFGGCSSLTSVTIPNSVTSIGQDAFYNCSNLIFVTCYAATPPELGQCVFDQVDCRKIPLYVPANSVDAYKAVDQWKDFYPILPISAKETETNTVKAEPTETSVDVTWPSVTGAATYELVIKDKNDKVICTMIFNAQGQLASIAFNAPSRNGAPQHTQAAGFSFTVTGLEMGTEYNLTITAKSANGQALDKRNVTFRTNWPTVVEDLYVNSDKPVKVLHDGHIYILRGEKVYDAEGKMVK